MPLTFVSCPWQQSRPHFQKEPFRGSGFAAFSPKGSPSNNLRLRNPGFRNWKTRLFISCHPPCHRTKNPLKTPLLVWECIGVHSTLAGLGKFWGAGWGASAWQFMKTQGFLTRGFAISGTTGKGIPAALYKGDEPPRIGSGQIQPTPPPKFPGSTPTTPARSGSDVSPGLDPRVAGSRGITPGLVRQV